MSKDFVIYLFHQSACKAMITDKEDFLNQTFFAMKSRRFLEGADIAKILIKKNDAKAFLLRFEIISNSIQSNNGIEKMPPDLIAINVFHILILKN